MKKIITLFLVALMMFTFAVSVSAAPVATGLNISFVEDGTGLITATFSVVGLKEFVGIQPSIQWDSSKVQLLKNDKTTVATTSASYADVVTQKIDTVWTNGIKTDWKLNASNLKLGFNRNGTDKVYVDCTASTDICEIYFKKVAGQTIDSDTFKFYKKTGIGSYETQYVFGNSNTTLKQSANTDKFDISVTPYTAPGGETWEDTIDSKLPTGDDVKFPAAKGEDSTVDNDAKKVVIFAKNTTGDKLVGTESGVANYGITIGGMYYPGFLDVPAGANWSIILVDPNGELTGKSFSASATVGSETKPLSNVSFE